MIPGHRSPSYSYLNFVAGNGKGLVYRQGGVFNGPNNKDNSDYYLLRNKLLGIR